MEETHNMKMYRNCHRRANNTREVVGKVTAQGPDGKPTAVDKYGWVKKKSYEPFRKWLRAYKPDPGSTDKVLQIVN